MSKHLKIRNTSYLPHFRFAFGAGMVLIKAGFISVLHSLIPDFMPSYAEKKTLALARLARMKNVKQYNTYRRS
jgi:hypothetical protein